MRADVRAAPPGKSRRGIIQCQKMLGDRIEKRGHAGGLFGCERVRFVRRKGEIRILALFFPFGKKAKGKLAAGHRLLFRFPANMAISRRS